MLDLLLALAQAAAPQPVQCGTRNPCTAPGQSWGMISNSSSPQPVVVGRMPPIPRAVPTPPKLGPGRYELVVHWPEETSRADYRRTFKDGTGCLKARAAVNDEHRARMAAIAVNMSNLGVALAMELDAPYAVCVPLG